MGRSKRERKQKAVKSLKHKRGTNSTLGDLTEEALDAKLLSIESTRRQDVDEATEDLMAGNPGDPPLILPPRVRKEKGSKKGQQEGQLRQLSKSQQRKLRRVQEEKAARAARAGHLATLASSQLPQEHYGLLKSAAKLGQRETKRERLRRELAQQRLGLAVPDDSDLFRVRGAPNGAEPSSSGEESEGKLATIRVSAASNPAIGPSAASNKRKRGSNPMARDGGRDSEGDTSDEEALRDADEATARGASGEGGEGGAARVSEPRENPKEAAEKLKKAAQQVRAELGLPPNPEEAAGKTLGPHPPPSADSAQPARVTYVQRSAEVEEARSGLPIISMEQEIVEAVTENDVLVLSGETGCGKTTQVPQFLYEAGYGNPAFPERCGRIGVTQPRRVAAIASAQRVAHELGAAVGASVGYQVRYDRRVADATAIKFMTDGILLREVQSDFLLRRYSVILVDEAHERSLNTDLLIGLLSRIVPLRRQMAESGQGHPLKLIIMSATLRTEDFVDNQRLFPAPPPLITVPARQFPVTVHFSRRTELHDYVGAAFAKASKIHRQLPPGGILIFVTGQREVEYLCRRLRKAFPPPGSQPARAPKPRGDSRSAASAHPPGRVAEGPGEVRDDGNAQDGEADEELEGVGDVSGGDAAEQAGDVDTEEEPREDDEEVDDFEEGEGLEDEEDVIVMGGDGFSPEDIAAAERRFEEVLGVNVAALAGGGAGTSGEGGEGGEGGTEAERVGPGPVHVLPLYAMLPKQAQARVFMPPPPGHRLIVVATNVAETSLTIPGVRYVVDTGRSKQKLMEGGGAMARYDVRWISKASGEQRAGRAGRTGPGHCYRLFSSAVFNDTFPQHSPPEILLTPLEGVLLSMKAMGVDKVINFPYPSPPEVEALRAAEQRLVDLGALQGKGGALTDLGRSMAAYPIAPHHSRMLLQALSEATGGGNALTDLPAYAVALAAAVTVESPYIHIDSLAPKEGETEAALKARRGAAGAAHALLRHPLSDALSALAALLAWEAAGRNEAFCQANFLHSRNLREMAALRTQLARLAPHPQGPEDLTSSDKKENKKDKEGHSLMKVLPSKPPTAVANALRRALAAGWADQVAQRVRAADALAAAAKEGLQDRKAVRYRPCGLESHVFLHPRSALARSAPAYVVYTQLLHTAKRPYMTGVTQIEAEWLPDVAAPMCAMSDPLPEYPPRYMAERDAVMCRRQVRYGRYDIELPHAIVPHPDESQRVAAFAAALLEGSVLPSFADLKSDLLLTPATAMRPSARGQKRVGQLLDSLERFHVDSRASLGVAWRGNPALFQSELVAWFGNEGARRLRATWPRLLGESLSRTCVSEKGMSDRRKEKSGVSDKREGVSDKRKKKKRRKIDLVEGLKHI